MILHVSILTVYSAIPWCFNMLSLLYVAGPHVKQPLADELS